MEIVRYSNELRNLWNENLVLSRTPHFMFHRDYIEYHSDRFEDCSFIFINRKGKIVALFPANIDGEIIFSHQGLSFGGLILSKTALSIDVHEIFSVLISWIAKNTSVKKLIYKKIPEIYSTQPNQEDLYYLHKLGASIFRRDLSTTINLNDPLPFQSMRRRLAQKGAKADLKIQKSTPSEIWPTLESVLFERHNVRPVHSMSEMTLLRNLFQENIFCWAAKYKESVLSCVIIYDACSVAHAQYIANSELGRSFGALDFLFQELIEIHYADNLFFDFGISCEKEGTYLNQGLINQKQGFGGRGIVHDFYELTIER
tara:strand:- start:176 stop:1117 length:942 start_codon:yes stop_codon:yes gene_type:complete